MVLGFHTRVLNHAAGIGLQTRHGTANVAVDFDNLLHGGGLEEGRGYALLYAEDYAFACCNLLGIVSWSSGLTVDCREQGMDVGMGLEKTHAYRC